MKKQIRVGVYGANRGGFLCTEIISCGAEVVAICDAIPEAIASSKKDGSVPQNCAEYADFDEFIKHDMDVVLLANYFCDHAKYAIKAMRAGKHVLSETLSNVTMAEGVALCRAKEETGMTYALLENYPYFKGNMEMERVFKGGTLGNLVYAEGEYVHPMEPDEFIHLSPGEYHWRNWTPRTYYSTHALAPLMQMTDSMPTRVTAMASFQPEGMQGTACHVGDAAAVLLCETDKNAILRAIGWAVYSPHGNHYRICCTRGGMETTHDGKLKLSYNYWVCPEEAENEKVYDEVNWPDPELGRLAASAGHGGGDFFAIYHFLKAVEEGTEPYWNVYRATAAASVAILGWRSILNGNIPYDIPDFRKEEDRLKYENDTLSPYPDENGKADIPCSSKPYTPSPEDVEHAHEIWKRDGYRVRYDLA